VRVVGTNGKGTVSHLIAAGLTAAGHRTGLFLSPHVERFEERVSVDGARVTAAEVVGFVARAREALARYAPDGDSRPAFFELTLALALDAFARRGTEWAVLEAGVGGATDATTAAAAPGRVRLVVLTNVDLDHVATIGPGLADIAREKAGAFAAGVPAVTAACGPSLEVVRAVAAAVGAPLHEVEPLRPGESTRSANERLAARALELLGVPEDARAAALAAPPLPGRGERFVARAREVLLDGAHDPAAAARLAQEAGEGFTLLFGALTRKQGTATLAALEPHAAAVVITEAAPGEGVDHLLGPGREVVPDPAAALRRALALTPEGGRVVVAGSLYLAGRLRPLLDSPAAWSR
jgi:dihydrofolate synthase/folylpolyglutamate synthase